MPGIGSYLHLRHPRLWISAAAVALLAFAAGATFAAPVSATDKPVFAKWYVFCGEPHCERTMYSGPSAQLPTGKISNGTRVFPRCWTHGGSSLLPERTQRPQGWVKIGYHRWLPIVDVIGWRLGTRVRVQQRIRRCILPPRSFGTPLRI